MSELLQASAQFPTVIFTIALGIALVYWVFVLLGALDLDLLGAGDAAGSAKGGVEGLKGIGDALAGAKGSAEGLKPDLQGQHEAGHHDGGVWTTLGLGSVPITISLSAIFLIGWSGSLLAMEYLAPLVGHASWFPGVVLLGMVVVSMPTAALLVRPLKPVFAFREGKSNRDYVGHVCIIDTGRVDHDFGQATLEDGGTVLTIPVRCDRPEVFARGDKALVIDFDDARQAYVVEPATDMLAAREGVSRSDD